MSVEPRYRKILNMTSLVPEEFDQVTLTFVPSGNGVGKIQTATYKKDGTTVATLTLSYNSDNKMYDVKRT